MRRARRTLALALASGLLLSGCAGGGDEPGSTPPPGGGDAQPSLEGQTGGELPDVTLDAFGGRGQPLDLGDLKGPAVVNVWASWCTPCRKELPYYQQLSQALDGEVSVIGIDFQDTQTEKAQQLIDDTGVTYPLYADPDGRVRAQVLPQVVLVDADGEVAYQQYVEIESLQQLEDLVAEHLGVGA